VAGEAGAVGPARPGRRMDIDRLRVIAVFLVFAVHVSQVFSPMGPWLIQDVETSLLLGQFTAFTAPWIMPLFMLLAGSGAWFSLRKHTGKEYLWLRFRRVGIPLLAGTILVIPPQMYYHRRHLGEFEGSFLAFYPHFFDGIYPTGNFSYGHLWFLAYLLLYSAITLPLLRLVDSSAGRRWTLRLAQWADRPGASIILSVPFVVPMAGLWARYPMTGALVNDWALHGWLLSAFLSGYILLAQPRFGELVMRRWREALVVGTAMSAVVLAFAMEGNALARLPSRYGPGYFAFWTAWGVAGGSWLLVALGAGRAWLGGPSRFQERWGDTAYPFYIIHQPVIVMVAYYVVHWPVPLPLRVLLAFTLSLAGTLLVVEGLRRFTPLRVVFGLAGPELPPGTLRA
jgi:glucans biosynthesis protein C